MISGWLREHCSFKFTQYEHCTFQVGCQENREKPEIT